MRKNLISSYCIKTYSTDKSTFKMFTYDQLKKLELTKLCSESTIDSGIPAISLNNLSGAGSVTLNSPLNINLYLGMPITINYTYNGTQLTYDTYFNNYCARLYFGNNKTFMSYIKCFDRDYCEFDLIDTNQVIMDKDIYYVDIVIVNLNKIIVNYNIPNGASIVINSINYRVVPTNNILSLKDSPAIITANNYNDKSIFEVNINNSNIEEAVCVIYNNYEYLLLTTSDYFCVVKDYKVICGFSINRIIDRCIKVFDNCVAVLDDSAVHFSNNLTDWITGYTEFWDPVRNNYYNFYIYNITQTSDRNFVVYTDHNNYLAGCGSMYISSNWRSVAFNQPEPYRVFNDFLINYGVTLYPYSCISCEFYPASVTAGSMDSYSSSEPYYYATAILRSNGNIYQVDNWETGSNLQSECGDYWPCVSYDREENYAYILLVNNTLRRVWRTEHGMDADWVSHSSSSFSSTSGNHYPSVSNTIHGHIFLITQYLNSSGANRLLRWYSPTCRYLNLTASTQYYLPIFFNGHYLLTNDNGDIQEFNISSSGNMSNLRSHYSNSTSNAARAAIKVNGKLLIAYQKHVKLISNDLNVQILNLSNIYKMVYSHGTYIFISSSSTVYCSKDLETFTSYSLPSSVRYSKYTCYMGMWVLGRYLLPVTSSSISTQSDTSQFYLSYNFLSNNIKSNLNFTHIQLN